MSEVQPVQSILDIQKTFYQSGATLTRRFRVGALKKLSGLIRADEEAILSALAEDLGKSRFEAYTNEIGILYLEIRHALRHLSGWMKPERTRLEYFHLPGSGRIYKEPYGNTLIISPWNYPFQLLMSPLIGAIAAGNTAVCKPSELAPATEALLARLINDNFDPGFIRVVTGGPALTSELLELPWDKIFFTGSVRVGKIVMQAAARHLTPVTLELGGKSPTIVDETANLRLAARKIAWGKWNNAGQTCVAPDYILAHASIKDTLVAYLKESIVEFFGADPSQSPHYGRIINNSHMSRLEALLDCNRCVTGGATDKAARYMAPTILDPATWDMPVMADEIFGPILPVLTFNKLDEAIAQVRARPKPLALYLFSNSRENERRVMTELSFGGGGVNTTILQVASSYLPFGGVGPSGLGDYHGKASFDAFTHRKSVLKQSSLLDPGLVYPGRQVPMSWIKKIMG